MNSYFAEAKWKHFLLHVVAKIEERKYNKMSRILVTAKENYKTYARNISRSTWYTLIGRHKLPHTQKYGGSGLVAAMSNSCDSMDCSPPGSSVHGISQEEYCSVLPFPGDLLDTGIDLTSPALQVFTAEPPGKPYSKSCILY